MCDVNDRLEESTTPTRVRWSGLYVRAGLMLAVLLPAQAFVPAGAERTVLQCGLALVGFGAMAQWTRRNRAALDRLDWCACASSRTTMRVVASGRAAADVHATPRCATVGRSGAGRARRDLAVAVEGHALFS
jgi:hypothetical protein